MRILVVDDSKAMRMIVLSNLRKAGFSKNTFVEASNGTEALKLIKEGLPDLILSDWNMPEMNGIGLLKEISHLSEEKQIASMPIFVFVTSESSEDMRQQAEQQGAKAFITKPFSVDDFEKNLAQFLKE